MQKIDNVPAWLVYGLIPVLIAVIISLLTVIVRSAA